MTINMTTKRRVVIENEDEISEVSNPSSEEQQESDSDVNEEGSEDDSEFDENAPATNAGWVDSITKILKTNKPKGKKTLVLSKAKKLTDVRLKEKSALAGYQVESKDGEIKDEKIEKKSDAEVKLEPTQKRLKKKEICSLRIKPNILEKDRERTLSKVATKGVVQLFNAVRTQQKDIGQKLKEAGPLEVRKDKVLKNIDKRAFLDVLMGEKSQSIGDSNTKRNTLKSDNEATWSVLRDDFMMGAKLKDWDKDLEEKEVEEDNEMEVENE